jgi:hypothetical protein
MDNGISIGFAISKLRGGDEFEATSIVGSTAMVLCKSVPMIC